LGIGDTMRWSTRRCHSTKKKYGDKRGGWCVGKHCWDKTNQLKRGGGGGGRLVETPVRPYKVRLGGGVARKSVAEEARTRTKEDSRRT